MNDRERSRATAIRASNIVLAFAAAVFGFGILTTVVVLTDFEGSFGRGSSSPGFADYVRMAWPYAYATSFPGSILLAAGLWFRFAAVQTDLRAAEWEELLDVVEDRLAGIASEGGDDGADDSRPA